MGSITKTIDDGYYVTHERRGCRMRRRCRSVAEAEECLRHMIEDSVVDLPRIRFYFGEQVLILKKPNITPKYYSEAFESVYLKIAE